MFKTGVCPRGAAMRVLRYVLLGLAVVLGVGAADASTLPPNDPAIIIVGGGSTTSLTTLSFTLTPNNLTPCSFNGFGDGFCISLVNVTGQNLTSFQFTFPAVTGTLSGFSNLGFTVLPGFPTSGSTITFLGGFVGQTNGTAVFTIGVFGFPTNTTFNVQANVPEPASITLFATGLGALLTGRALRRRVSSRRHS